MASKPSASSSASPSMGGNKGFILLFLFLAIAGLVLFLTFGPSDAKRLNAARESVTNLTTEVRTRTLPHTVFDRALTPGNAWEEYNIALSNPSTWKEGDPNDTFLGSVDKFTDLDKIEQFLAKHTSAIEHLQLGAHRSEGQYPYDWNKGSQMPKPNRLGSRRLAGLATIQAWLLREKGKTQESMDLLVDTIVFGRDVATNAPLPSNLVGVSVYYFAFREMSHWIASGKGTRQQLVDLDKKLAIIELDFPSASTGLRSGMLTLGILQKEMAEGGAGTDDWWQLVKSGHVRLLIFPQDTIAQALEERNGYLRRVEKLDQMDFDASRREADAIVDEMGKSRNALISEATPGMKVAVMEHRDTFTRLRLLRAATGFLVTGKVPALRDPFGDTLHSRQENEKTRIWSVGRDGKNQNGRGDWDISAEDIVLEIPSPK